MKYRLLVLSIVFFSALAAQAQTDTIHDERNQIPKDLPVPQPKENSDSDLIPIQNNKLPAPLRQALLHEQYAGWETAGVYQSKSTGEYSIEIKTAGDSRKFRFDSKGQPMTGLSTAPGLTPPS